MSQIERSITQDVGSTSDLISGSWWSRPLLSTWTFVDLACAMALFSFVCELTDSQVNRYGAGLVPLIALMPLGLFFLISDAVSGHMASRLAVAALASGLVSVLLSAAPMMSLFGAVQRHNSWIVYLSGFSLFALARRVTSGGRDLLVGTLLLAVILSGAMAVVEVIFQPTMTRFALIDVRPRGLSLHPVYLAEFAVAACAICCWRLAREARLRDVVVVGVMSFLVGLAASRVAMVALIAMICLALARSRERSARLWLLPGAALAGVAASWALHSLAGTERSVVDRTASEGISDRLDVWHFGLLGWMDKPWFGWGPGRFAIAGQRYFTDEFTRRFELKVWDDAHNVFVELVTTWGVVGLVLVVAFTVVVIRSSSGPMLWLAGALAICWLLEPATPATIGVLAISLGVASEGRVDTSPSSIIQRSTGVVLAIAGALLATLIFVGGTGARLTERPIVAQPVGGVSIWYRYDPVLAGFYAKASSSAAEDLDTKMFWARRAVELEPEDGWNHAYLALVELRAGDLVSARRDAERSLQLQPSRETALLVLHNVALRQGDGATVTETRIRLCEGGREDFCSEPSP